MKFRNNQNENSRERDRRNFLRMTFAFGAVLIMLVSVLGITGSTDGSQAGSSGSPGSSNMNLPSTVSALDPLLIKEFNTWDSKTHVPFPSSQQSRATVLEEFLNNDPYGARIMNKIISIQETGFVPQTSPNATFDEYVIQHGNSTVTSVATYQTNGTVYSVIHVAYSLTVNDKSYRVNAAIIKLPNGKTLVDPLDTVQIDYLTFWFFGTVTYGEVDFIYQDFYYNAIQYTGQNYNEASVWRSAIDAITAENIGVALIDALFPALLSSLGIAVWVFTALWNAGDVAALAATVNTAYGLDQGIGFIPTYVQNDYIWDSYAGAITGNGWGVDVYENGNGWKVGLLPEAFSGVDSPGLSHVAHTFQNDYGNQWVWIGAFITPS